jgi:hypothetical protein
VQTHVFWPPGEGDPTTDFGRWLKEIFVIKWSFNNPEDTTWCFITNTGNIASGTAGMKAGKHFEACETAVPGCAGFAEAAVTTERIMTLEDGQQFRVVEDPYTQCLVWVYKQCRIGAVAPAPDACPAQTAVIECENGVCPVPNADCTDGQFCDADDLYTCGLGGDPNKCEYALDREPIDEALQSTEDGEGVTAVSGAGPCGRAVIKTGEESGWFWTMLGWIFRF